MGYQVIITPSAGRTGFLQRGKLAPAWSIGTYYHHPSSARLAASNWLKKHPGGKAKVVTFKYHEVLEELS